MAKTVEDGMLFYRGISGTANEVEGEVEDARGRGVLRPSNRKDQALPSEVRNRMFGRPLTAVHARTAIEASALRPMAYASGNRIDASGYAKGNVDAERAVVIEFEVHEDDVTCDPLDALHGLFGAVSLVPHGVSSPACDALAVELGSLYGTAIGSYLEAARGQSPKDAEHLCEVACRDLEIVRHHHANLRPILGRVGFPFSSVFRVPSSIDRGTVRILEPIAAEARTAFPLVSFDGHRAAVRAEAGFDR